MEYINLISTLSPNSAAIASAKAVFPVPGGPASKIPRPAIFFDLINSTTKKFKTISKT